MYRLFHLGCEFAGGGQYQGANANAAKFVLGRVARGQFVQHGQHEGSGFARARLGAAQQVVSFKDDGNGLFLNGGGRGVTLLKHGLDNGRSQV